MAAFTGGIVGPHYAASKAGLHGLTHFLASRFAGSGVTVNALVPALVAGTGTLPGDPGELSRQVPVGRPDHRTLFYGPVGHLPAGRCSPVGIPWWFRAPAARSSGESVRRGRTSPSTGPRATGPEPLAAPEPTAPGA